MNEIKIMKYPENVLLTANDLKIGEVGVIRYPNDSCKHIARVGNTFFLLQNPSYTWEKSCDIELAEILPAGTVLEITLGRVDEPAKACGACGEGSLIRYKQKNKAFKYKDCELILKNYHHLHCVDCGEQFVDEDYHKLVEPEIRKFQESVDAKLRASSRMMHGGITYGPPDQHLLKQNSSTGKEGE